MGSTLFGRLRYVGVVAMTALATICSSAALAQRAAPNLGIAQTETRGAVADRQPVAEATRPPSTIPEPPTLAPRREPIRPATVPADRMPPGVKTAAGSSRSRDSLEVTLRAGAEQGPVDETTAVTAEETPDAPEEEPLKPIPAAHGSTAVEVGTASFNGVTPGVTTAAELQKAWGTASKIAKREGALVHLYTVEPFDRVEVSVYDDVVTSIVIRLDRTFPTDVVTKQLELSDIRPVFISNPLGEILGQGFPERGVLVAFAPGEDPTKPSMQVAQIILEPVSAEPFVLRAETYLDSQLELSVADLQQAIRLDPKDARAQWLYARALTALGDTAEAAEASAEAVRLSPKDAQYRATLAQILGQTNRFDEAIREAQTALANSEKRPHVRARTLCLLGDLFGSGPKADYKQAIEHHMKAIQAAEPLIEDPHPAIRLAAKEVLIDAHLGAAHDIAWGGWNQKEVAVARWLKRAEELADELTDDEALASQQRFHIAQRAMAIYVGLKGAVDPTPWTEKTLRAADQAIATATNSLKKQQILWELGTALYDAVQIYQMRGEHDVALKCGEQAVQCFEQVAKAKDNTAADDYLLGRLYFRLGAVYAIGKKDHQQAVPWFEKAVAAFDRSIPELGPEEFGRLGETLVSIGVSYWESGRHDRAAEITTRGIKLIETAVDRGTLERSALEIPYGNLAAMQRSMDTGDTTTKPVQNAGRGKDTVLK